MDSEIPYEELRNERLPWGHWLVTDDEQVFHRYLDEDGKAWSSVREALWIGRLGMPRVHVKDMNLALEFLASVLAVIDRRTIGVEERVHSVFAKDWGMDRFYAMWLIQQRLIAPQSVSGLTLDCPLTPEGLAILVMLASTRSIKDSPLPLGMSWIRARRGLDHGTDRKAILDLVERQVAFARRLDYRLVRCELHERPALKMIGIDTRLSVPRSRTVWSMVHADEYARDRFYLWAHERIDQWEQWGRLARDDGAHALTSHLLGLRFCDERIAAG